MSEYFGDGSEEKNQDLMLSGANKPKLADDGDEEAEVDLENPETMAFVQGEMARKCTLCLESMKDPTVCLRLACLHLLKSYRLIYEIVDAVRPHVLLDVHIR